MSTPIIHWIPIAEFMAMQAMEDAYDRYGVTLQDRDLVAFEDMHVADYRWIRLDETILCRGETVLEMESLFDSTDEPIQFKERLIAVTARDNVMKVRAVKELHVGGVDLTAQDVEETWRLDDGRWRLVETRECGG